MMRIPGGWSDPDDWPDAEDLADLHNTIQAALRAYRQAAVAAARLEQEAGRG